MSKITVNDYDVLSIMSGEGRNAASVSEKTPPDIFYLLYDYANDDEWEEIESYKSAMAENPKLPADLLSEFSLILDYGEFVASNPSATAQQLTTVYGVYAKEDDSYYYQTLRNLYVNQNTPKWIKAVIQTKYSNIF
jgi:hypothetical protein